MAWKKDLVITTSFISFLSFCCNNVSKTAKEDEYTINMMAGTAVTGSNNTVDFLSQSKDHSIFFNLLKKSGLIETLKQPGPFTVFAPTNKAFEKLPASTIKNWGNKEHSELLNFLGNHIVAGALEIDDLQKINKLKTLSGDEFTVRSGGENIFVNGQQLSKGNIVCVNGRIYVMDETLMPRLQKN